MKRTIPLYLDNVHILFICPSADGHLGCFQFLAVTINSTANVLVQILVWLSGYSGRQSNAPHIHGVHLCSSLWNLGICFTIWWRGIKFTSPLILRQWSSPGLSVQVQRNHESLWKRKRMGEQEVRVTWSEDARAVSGFGKGKDSPLEPPEEQSSGWALDFSPLRSELGCSLTVLVDNTSVLFYVVKCAVT